MFSLIDNEFFFLYIFRKFSPSFLFPWLLKEGYPSSLIVVSRLGLSAFWEGLRHAPAHATLRFVAAYDMRYVKHYSSKFKIKDFDTLTAEKFSCHEF